MDPRGASPLDDPRGALGLLREQRSIDLPCIDAARERADAETARIRANLAEAEVQPGVATCVFGSWARAELTEDSDHDWAVVVADDFKTYDRRVVLEYVAASAELGNEDHHPGSQDLFGVPFAIEQLVANVGLDGDTNTNFTRRMLFLLESLELHGTVREDAIARILARYLSEGIKPRSVPRFLLNDVIRYWRTICVDFEGKAVRTEEPDEKWAMRNAKLRTSRKLLYVGGLVTVLLSGKKADAGEMQAFLTAWLDASPLDRLAGAFLYAAEVQPGILDSAVRTFTAYERWLALASDGGARSELKKVTPETRDESAIFEEVRKIGEAFEAGLIELAFSRAFDHMTRSSAIF